MRSTRVADRALSSNKGSRSPPGYLDHSEALTAMSQQKKGDMVEVLHTATLAGYEPEIGRWLWAMEAVRRRTLDIVKDLDEQTLDWEGPD